MRIERGMKGLRGFPAVDGFYAETLEEPVISGPGLQFMSCNFIECLKKRAFRLASVLMMLTFFAGTLHGAETGLVLSGGGGKGAYEVGVWKALAEYGIAQEVSIITGTSVGGLNAALFALLNVQEVEDIWKNVVPSCLTLDEENNEVYISQYGLGKIIDMMPLEKLKDGYPMVVVNTMRASFLSLKVVASYFNIVKPGDYSKRFRLDLEEESEMKQKLLATSAFPILTDNVLLNDGYYYVDGGWEDAGGDNTPIEGLFSTGYEHADQIRDIYVVYLENQPARRIKVTDYDKFNIIEIIPSIDLSDLFDGTCNFTEARINLLVETGYKDTVKLLKERGRHPVSGFWFQ